MHISEIKNAIIPDEAIEKLKLNSGYMFKWFIIKGKNGCVYEMGGRNAPVNGLELIICVPFYKKGLPRTLPKLLHKN